MTPQEREKTLDYLRTRRRELEQQRPSRQSSGDVWESWWQAMTDLAKDAQRLGEQTEA